MGVVVWVGVIVGVGRGVGEKCDVSTVCVATLSTFGIATGSPWLPHAAKRLIRIREKLHQ